MVFMHRSEILFTCQGCARLFKFLPLATKLGQGYIFTGVCHSVNGMGGVPAPEGGGWAEGMSGPGGVACSQGGSSGDPRDGHCCGRYASYWNAFLYIIVWLARFFWENVFNSFSCLSIEIAYSNFAFLWPYPESHSTKTFVEQ